MLFLFYDVSMVDRLYCQRVRISARLKRNTQFTELNMPFNSCVKNPFETISSLLASNSPTSQLTDEYFPFKYFARSVVKYTTNAPARSAVEIEKLVTMQKKKNAYVNPAQTA